MGKNSPTVNEPDPTEGEDILEKQDEAEEAMFPSLSAFSGDGEIFECDVTDGESNAFSRDFLWYI